MMLVDHWFLTRRGWEAETAVDGGPRDLGESGSPLERTDPTEAWRRG